MVLYQNRVEKSIAIYELTVGFFCRLSRETGPCPIPVAKLSRAQPIVVLRGILIKRRKEFPYMKRLLCILFAVLLFAACAVKTVPSANSGAESTEKPLVLSEFPVPEITGYADFSDVLSAKLINGTENQNLSPISIYLALAMTAEGAEGKTKDAMLKLLGCKGFEELRAVCGGMLEKLSIDSEYSTLAIADSIWTRKDVVLHEAYRNVLADAYRSEANSVNFGTADASKRIAKWIGTHTHDKIKISPDALQFDSDTVAVLINTIYLKDAWRDEFWKSRTETGTFFGLDGEQNVRYMYRRDESASIVQGDGFTRYSLPLLRVGRMTFVLPDEGTPLSALLGTPEKLRALLNDGEAIKANVNVKLPKFEFQDRFDLEDALQSLGIGIAFTGEADFSGMCDHGVSISKVLQESYIGVDENGVEAAAYTMVAMDESAPMPEDLPEIDFFLTRPFLFVIEGRDGTALFIGTVTEPTPADQ